MKLIHNLKSPNFNERKSNKIELIVIHYTAISSLSESIKYLCSKKNKVSSHYLISKKGEVYSLVSENKRAWHAGQAYWKEKIDINSNSIGIELDYNPSNKNDKFTKNLIISLAQLLDRIIKKYKILPDNILGHSDISPYRKKDPGIHFPWFFFEDKNIVYKIKKFKKNIYLKRLIDKWFLKNKMISKRNKILFMLNFIGYDVKLAIKNKNYYNQLIISYSYRYKFYKNHKINLNKITYVIELHFLNIVLTKLKK